ARHRLLPLRLSLGLDEIAEALDFGEIELAVEEGATSELAGLGEPQTGQGRNRANQRSNDGGRAVHLQLGRILARERVRTRHPGDEAGVDELGVEMQWGEGEPPRLRLHYGEPFQNGARVWSGNADHGDAGGQGT